MSKWKKIKGYEDWYEINEVGTIRYTFDKACCNGVRIRKGKKLKASIIGGKGRYRRIGLTNHLTGERKSYNVHRLVALTFLPNPENKPQVNHIDGDRENNSISNLEWVTASENVIHAIDNNLRNTPTGEFRNDVTYNKDYILGILDMYYKFQKTYREISDEVGIRKEYVALVVKGKRWVGVYKNYTEGEEDYFERYCAIANKRRSSNMSRINEELRSLSNERLA